jgi:hypothetical protein
MLLCAESLCLLACATHAIRDGGFARSSITRIRIYTSVKDTVVVVIIIITAAATTAQVIDA